MERKVYMDHGATTPLRQEVLEAMLPFMQEKFGNPSSLYGLGREARKAVEDAREKVAAAIGASPEEIVFTSGGTEADNLAVRGAVKALSPQGGHIITSAVEHHAVLDVCRSLQEEGYRVTFLPVDGYGLVDPGSLEEAIDDDTVLVSIMTANNEVGTIQPVEEIGEIVRERGILFHTDAVQAVGNIPVDVRRMKADLLSLSAHKFYGPKGVGVLYVRRGVNTAPVNYGGGQERGLRPGTENVAGIVGLGKAIELAVGELTEYAGKLRRLRDRLIEGLLTIEKVYLNGHPTHRLPGNVNVSFAYIEGESLLLSLDIKGIAASSGSACTSGSLEPSHVLTAMGVDHQTAHGSLRLTLGRDNTADDVDYVLEALPPIVDRLRKMSPIQDSG